MEKRIKKRYSEQILHEAMARYEIDPDDISLLDGFESFMYAFKRKDLEAVLRIGHSLRRSEPMIQAEVNWINYLAAGGATVSRAIPSRNNHLVEAIDDDLGGQFLATAFVQAPGHPPGKEDWNSDLFRRYGRLIGRMHALSRGYKPVSVAWRRPHWNDPLMLDVERWLNDGDYIILEQFRRLLSELKALPRDKAGYGLIHQDAHAGNFFVDDEGLITLFDFDDCVYSWYINDIAIVLFYAVMWEKDKLAFSHYFLDQFFQGYNLENELDPGWLRTIPAFLKLREIDLYAIIQRSYDMSTVSDPWILNYMNGRKERIESGRPYLD